MNESAYTLSELMRFKLVQRQLLSLVAFFILFIGFGYLSVYTLTAMTIFIYLFFINFFYTLFYRSLFNDKLLVLKHWIWLIYVLMFPLTPTLVAIDLKSALKRNYKISIETNKGYLNSSINSKILSLLLVFLILILLNVVAFTIYNGELHFRLKMVSFFIINSVFIAFNILCLCALIVGKRNLNNKYFVIFIKIFDLKHTLRIINHINYNLNKKNLTISSKEEEMLNQIIDHRGVVNTKKILKDFNISQTTLNKLVKRVYNMTYQQLILISKMKYADELIKDKKETIEEIARITGYESRSSFYKAYKKFKSGSYFEGQNSK